MNIKANEWLNKEMAKNIGNTQDKRIEHVRVFNSLTIAVNSSATISTGQILIISRFIQEEVVQRGGLDRTEESKLILQLATFINTCK